MHLNVRIPYIYSKMIPFVDLKKQHVTIKNEIDKALEIVIYKNSHFILGDENKLFEEEFSSFCGRKYGIGVNSGTDALILAMHSLNIKDRDEVIVPVNTAIPTVMAIRAVGATPKLVDVNDNYLIDINKIEQAINDKTKIIMPVHLYGNVCHMDSILELAKKYKLKVIEDCCQAHGAEFNGKKVPIGEIGCFSFYPSKNLGCLGDGGMIIVDDETLKEKLVLLRNYGQENRYHAKVFGINSRLDEIQAAILRIKLKYLEDFNKKRRELANLYNSLLKDIVKIPDYNVGQIYHLYIIRVNSEKRNSLMDYLKENGIQTQIHYPIPIHLQEAFSYLGYNNGDFPNAEKYSKEIISLPMFPELMKDEVTKVCKEIRRFLK